jgi:unsaturated rhamnogalacturonyl hydrolase
MKRYTIYAVCMMLSLSVQARHTISDYFRYLPSGSDPKVVGAKLTERFLSQGHSQYGSPLRVNEPRTQITYPDVCTWLGGLRFAKAEGNEKLTQRLIDRFQPLFGRESYLLPKPNHVDNNVFGALPLELFMQTKDAKYKKLGMAYADTQWQLPSGWTLKNQSQCKSQLYGDFVDVNVYRKEQKDWADKGYSWQTRFWLDDMYMITTVQTQAYLATGDKKYLDRAAREMVLYLDSIQQPSGLFYHAPDAHFYWSRGNGWMAVGMSDMLKYLPESSTYYQPILNGYKRMMSSLKRHQGKNGLWHQLIDDPSFWDETSGSAMFTYAMIQGIKNGWLPASEYGPVARQAWISLTKLIDAKGDVKGVCEGTNIGTDKEHYRNRKAITGDLHGQAPMLWCASALLSL